MYAGGGPGPESWTEALCAPLARLRAQIQIMGEASVLAAADMQVLVQIVG